jgi:hypothetical protein
LVFSNAIFALTLLALTLLLATGGSVNALVPLFAMGVFSAFAMAGFGMTRHHFAQRGRGWRYKVAVNLSAGTLSTLVVGIFAVAKFTEGAWLIVVVFPILVVLLIRMNRKYRAEAAVLEIATTDRPLRIDPPRNQVFLFVDSIDLAEMQALRYAKSLRADDLTAVHFVLDPVRAAQLQDSWGRFDYGAPLRLIDCPDRTLTQTAQALVLATRIEHPDTQVTVLLPRRTHAPLVDRLLHDRTADKIARFISRISGASAQIVAYDVGARVRGARANPVAADPDGAPPSDAH